jgi:hypothetical protein
MVLRHDIASAEAPRVPRWERAASAMLASASPQVLVLAHCTPTNLQDELLGLRADFEAGNGRLPAFEYTPPPSLGMLDNQLQRVADTLERGQPLAQLYARRARELALEAQICMSAGSDGLAALAQARYGCSDGYGELADELCREWLAGARVTANSHSGPTCVSDDEEDPHSLLVRMRRLVGQLRLPFRVVASSRLAALAATGPGVIYVARGSRMTRHAVERTVLHEVEGHALPRHQASRMPLGIFAFGSARGSDDQEGRAIALEESASLLDPARRAELALRHIAGRTIAGGADFVGTVDTLRREHAAPLDDAQRIAARAHRGGGLCRELMYLPAYLRVRERPPQIEEVMSRGQIALDAAPQLASWCAASQHAGS